MKDTDLVIPIYLDVQALLDLLASIEDGFRMVETQTTRVTDSKTSEVSGTAGFGINNVLSIFKMDLKASGKVDKEQEGEEVRQGERYHTYGSLMNRLRKNIIDMGLIKEVKDEDSWNELNGSEFIEMRGKFVPNPLITNLNTFKRLFDIMEMGINAPINVDELKKMSKPQRKQAEKNRKEDAKRQLKEAEGYKGLIDGILSDIEDENSQTYVIEAENLPNHRIVTDLFKEYIRDRSGIELYNAEFRILGKVVRNVNEGDSINLLRGSALGSNEGFIFQLIATFKQLEAQGFSIPDIYIKVEAPAIQVIPIAIYV